MAARNTKFRWSENTQDAQFEDEDIAFAIFRFLRGGLAKLDSAISGFSA
jgi:hypothetical protein